jgi:hypothetical protein
MDGGGVQDRPFQEPEAAVALERPEVLHTAGGKVVQRPDFIAFVEKCFAEV